MRSSAAVANLLQGSMFLCFQKCSSAHLGSNMWLLELLSFSLCSKQSGQSPLITGIKMFFSLDIFSFLDFSLYSKVVWEKSLTISSF